MAKFIEAPEIRKAKASKTVQEFIDTGFRIAQMVEFSDGLKAQTVMQTYQQIYQYLRSNPAIPVKITMVDGELFMQRTDPADVLK